MFSFISLFFINIVSFAYFNNTFHCFILYHTEILSSYSLFICNLHNFKHNYNQILILKLFVKYNVWILFVEIFILQFYSFYLLKLKQKNWCLIQMIIYLLNSIWSLLNYHFNENLTTLLCISSCSLYSNISLNFSLNILFTV